MANTTHRIFLLTANVTQALSLSLQSLLLHHLVILKLVMHRSRLLLGQSSLIVIVCTSHRLLGCPGTDIKLI